MIDEKVIETQLKYIKVVAEYEGSSLTDELDKLIEAGPLKDGVDFYKGYAFDVFVCPRCKRPIGDEAMSFSYCPGCGQRIKKI